MDGHLPTTLRSLHIRNYRLFASGQLVSQVGNWMQVTAQDWLVLKLSDNSGSALGWVTALQFLPVVLLTLYGGKLADRYDKRRLLLITNTAAGLCAVLTAALILTGRIELWHVYVLAACRGAVGAIDNPSRQSFVNEMVGPRLLPNAIALNSASFNVARVLGPAVSGVLIALIDTGPVFLVNGLAYVGTVAGLLAMDPARLNRSVRAARETGRIVDGVRYAAARPDLLLPMALMFVVGGMGVNFQLTLALMAKTVFHRGAASFGLLATALGVGALIGALASSRRTERPSAYTLIGSAVAFGAFEFAAGLAPSYLTAAGILLFTGFFMIYVGQAAGLRVQLGVDERYRGRVLALYLLLFQASAPVCAPLLGWLAEHVGARAGMWVGGLASICAALVVLTIRSRQKHVTLRIRVRPTLHLLVSEPLREDLRIPAGRAHAAR
ncbi:MAG: MFS transporter [Actinocatenispora sp.]